VVIALVVPDPELALVVPDPDAEVVTPDPELEPFDVVLVTAALFCDSAGSCPETSWTKVTAQSATNVTSAVAITRLRSRVTRRRRARSRSPAIARPSGLGLLARGAEPGGQSWSIGTSICGWFMQWVQNRPPASVRRENRLSRT
jgi:hypothetical protein